MAKTFTGPGILYVEARISRPDLMDEPTYMNWYDNDHIAEIIETSGIKSAFRYKDVNFGTSRERKSPYLAMYPMGDLGFTQGDEFRKIRVKSDLLPGSGLCYDLADNDVRYYNLSQVYDPNNKGKGKVKTIITAQFEFGDNKMDEELDRWYREEHLEQLSKTPGYLRSTRFVLVYARSNAQSRALKGLPPTSNEPVPEPPKHLAIHEYEGDVDLAALKAATDTEWTRKIQSAATKMEHPVYNLVIAHGEGVWFHDL